MKYFFALLLFFNFTISMFIVEGQDQRIADSLSKIYYSDNKHSGDSAYLELLYNLSYYQSNPDSALKFSNKLIGYATQKSNERYIYRGLLQKGNALRLKGNLDDAASVLFDCASEAQKINYQRGVGCATMALADVYMSSDNHNTSIRYYHKAMIIFNNLKDSALLANITFNIGSEYLRMYQPDSALSYFNISEDLYQKLKNQSGIAYNAGNKGLAYSKLKNYKQAEINLLKAIDQLKQLKDVYAVTSYQIGLSKIYRKQGELNRAIKYAMDSYQSAMDYGLMPQVRDACEFLSELYELTGDYKQALKYQIEYVTNRDSIINEQKILQIADLRTEYEVAQKQIEVDLLQKKREKQKIIIASLAAIVFLIAVLVFLLLINNKRKQQINKQLAEQKEELESQRDLLEEQKEELEAQRDQLEQQKEELETQRDRLSELNQTKDRFFSIISHDLRGPISSLHGFSLILMEYMDSKNYKEIPALAEELNISINKVSSLLDNLLDWALSQQGRFPYVPSKLSLPEIIDDIIMSSSPMALAKNISIIKEVEDNLFIWADKNSLLTVFRNLVNNAIKFSYTGSNIEVKTTRKNDVAEITIKDFGVGIPNEKIKDLFKLKGDKSTWGTAQEKGTGLGLSLAYDFITMNKGTIEVESEVDKGTTFIVKIPVA